MNRNRSIRKMRTMRTSLFALVALGVLGSNTSIAHAAPRVVKIVGTDDMRYSVARIDAKAGEELKIVLTGQGAMPKDQMAHNLVVVQKDVKLDEFAMQAVMARNNGYIPKNAGTKVIAATGLAGGGETVEVTFKVPDTAGDYPYLCTFPGHFAGGMKGVLAVK